MENLEDKTRGSYIRVERASEAQQSFTETLDLALSPSKLYVRSCDCTRTLNQLHVIWSL